MRISTFKGEADLGEIVRRFYGKTSTAKRKQAERALLEANPPLASIRDMLKGSPLVIPRVPGLRARRRRSEAEPKADTVREIAESLEAYRGHLSAAAAAETADAKAAEATLKSSAMNALVKKIPDLADHRTRVRTATRDRLKRAEELRAFVDDDLASLAEDLDALIERLR